MKVKVQTLDSGKGGDIELNDAVFGVEPRADVLHRVVTWQLINRRAPARGKRRARGIRRRTTGVGAVAQRLYCEGHCETKEPRMRSVLKPC